MNKVLISLLICFSILSAVTGQVKTANFAKEILESDGSLLVLIPSNQNKIKALEKILSNKNINKKERERTANILAETNYQQHLIVKETIDAFENFYSFSDVIFAYDFELKRVLKGSNEISVLKSDGSFSTINLPATYLYCHFGKTDPAASTNIAAWLVKFSDGTMVPKPFPNPIATNPLKRALRGLLDDPEEEYRKNAAELAQIIQKKFINFAKN